MLLVMSATTITTTTALERWIYRCPKCKAARALDLEAIWTRVVTYVPGCRSGSTKRYTDVTRGPEVCACGTTMRGAEVRGRKNDEECGPRCWNAKGHDCECSCAGRKHGQAHK